MGIVTRGFWLAEAALVGRWRGQRICYFLLGCWLVCHRGWLNLWGSFEEKKIETLLIFEMRG